MLFRSLDEHGRAVGHRLGEQLEEMAVRFVVDENAKSLNLGPREVQKRQPVGDVLVVGVVGLEEPHSPTTQRADGLNDVVGTEGQMLNTGTPVGVDVLLNLALSFAVGRFVQGHHDGVAVPHHRGAKR